MNKALILILTITVMVSGKEASLSAKTPPIDKLSIKIKVGERETVVPLIESSTSREFIKLLPLTLTMDDLGGREKYSGLSQELSKEGTRTTTYQKGDLSYWLGGGIAAFYNQDDHQVKAGLIVLARLEKGIDLFSVPGSVTVKFEAVNK